MLTFTCISCFIIQYTINKRFSNSTGYLASDIDSYSSKLLEIFQLTTEQRSKIMMVYTHTHIYIYIYIYIYRLNITPLNRNTCQ